MIYPNTAKHNTSQHITAHHSTPQLITAHHSTAQHNHIGKGPNGVVVSMFDFHSNHRGSNPGCGGEIS